MKICNLEILTEQRKLEKVNLLIEDGMINAISPPGNPEDQGDVNAEGWIASPGWIDLQINGGFGHDLTTHPEALWEVAVQLPGFGVTGFLPTIITSPADVYQKALTVFRNGPPQGWRGARPFGWHFEGPFLNPQKKGAHNPAWLKNPDKELTRDWSRENGVAMVTMAPELDGADEIASLLYANGVVLSMGHSMATVEETRHAVEMGFTSATHLFNAMPVLDHRKPGLAGEVLVNPKITVGIIADEQHVHANMVRLAWKMKSPDRIVLVSDAVGALGEPPGEFIQGGFKIIVTKDSAKLPDGTLAGSVLRMDQALRNVMRITDSPVEVVLPSLGMNQAKLLKLDQFGQIKPGYCADLTLVDKLGNLKMTMVRGEVLYRAGSE